MIVRPVALLPFFSCCLRYGKVLDFIPHFSCCRGCGGPIHVFLLHAVGFFAVVLFLRDPPWTLVVIASYIMIVWRRSVAFK